MTSPGIDISGYQTTTPDLAGQAFCIVKATEGLWTDPMYATHIGNVRKAGIVTGAYHFARSDVSTPTKQAQNFLAVAGAVDLYALDVEGPFAFSLAQSTEFIGAMHAAGKRIGMYHSLSGFQYAGQDWDWVAYYNPTPPGIPWDIWQHGGVTIGGKTIDGDLAADLGALTGRAMAPHVKPGGTVIGTVTFAGSGHALISTTDTSVRYGNRPAGEVLNVIAALNLVDANGKPIDIDGHQPPVGNRDQIWLVDETAFGASAYALRADCTALVPVAPALTQADVNAAYLGGKQAGYDLAVSGASVGVPKVTFPPRPVA